MKRFRKTPKKSIFLTILLSYISIFLLPVMIGVFMFHQIQGNMIRDSNQAHLALLEQVKLAAENRFGQLDKLMLQIALNPKVQWVLGEGMNDYYGSRQMDFLTVINELGTVKNLNVFVSDIFVYLKNIDSVLTTTGKVDADTFFNHLLIYDGKSAETVRSELFSGSQFRKYYPNVSITNANGTTRALAYVQSLPPGEGLRPKGYFVALVQERELALLADQVQKVNNGDIYIVNEHGQLLFSTATTATATATIAAAATTAIAATTATATADATAATTATATADATTATTATAEAIANADAWPEADLVSGLPPDKGSREAMLNGRSMMLSYTSDSKGWHYISVVDKAELLGQVNLVKTQAVALLLLCLAGGIAGSYVLAYRYYSPIRDVVRSIARAGNNAEDDDANEFDIIHRSITRSFEENNRLSRTLSQHVPAFKANFLSRLLAGQVELSALNDESLQFMDVSFEQPCFAVIIVNMDDCSRFMIEDTEKEWALARFVLSNLSSHLLWEHGYIVEPARDRLAVLINCREPSDETVHRRDRFVHDLKQAANEQFRMQITISASDIHEGVDAIGVCYQEAQTALDYHLIYGPDVVIYYRDVARLQPLYYHYPLEQEGQLINLSRSGDEAGVRKLLDHIYESNVRSGTLSPEMGKLLFLDLMGTLIKAIKGLALSEAERIELSADSLRRLSDCTTAEEMLAHMKRMYGKVCFIAHGAKTDHGDQLHGNIARYIEQHYGDSNLSLTSMSEHFHLTAQYLSTFFKKHSGQNITEYISLVRVREAKRMLADSSLTVTDIAHSIGYANEVGFIRLFKKIEGITPGKYREMSENERNP